MTAWTVAAGLSYGVSAVVLVAVGWRLERSAMRSGLIVLGIATAAVAGFWWSLPHWTDRSTWSEALTPLSILYPLLVCIPAAAVALERRK